MLRAQWQVLWGSVLPLLWLLRCGLQCSLRQLWLRVISNFCFFHFPFVSSLNKFERFFNICLFAQRIRQQGESTPNNYDSQVLYWVHCNSGLLYYSQVLYLDHIRCGCCEDELDGKLVKSMHDHEEKAKFVSTSIPLTRIRLFINRGGGGGSDGDWIRLFINRGGGALMVTGFLTHGQKRACFLY